MMSSARTQGRELGSARNYDKESMVLYALTKTALATGGKLNVLPRKAIRTRDRSKRSFLRWLIGERMPKSGRNKVKKKTCVFRIFVND
jgi:hypothetical protein